MGYPYSSVDTKLSSVPASLDPVEIAPKQFDRKGFMIFNASTASLTLALNETVSDEIMTLIMPAQSFFECPYGYAGIVMGYWSAVNGSAKVTSFF